MRQAATKAVQLDASNAVAEAVLGWLDMVENYQLASAAKHFARALALEPTNPQVLFSYSMFMIACAPRADTLQLLRYIAAQDPANPQNYYYLSTMYYFDEQWQRAAENGRITLNLSPQYPTMHFFLGQNELAQGHVEAAHREMQAETAQWGALIGQAMSFHAMGNKPESDAALAKVIRDFQKDSAVNIAGVYAYRGDADQAFAWLEKAVQYRDSGIYMIMHDPVFKTYHKDPRWLPIQQKIGNAPAQLAAMNFKFTMSGEAAPR